MKKLILIIAIFIGFTAQAQKIKMTSGKLDFLKGQDKILVEFVYPENLKVGKLSEADYIKKKAEAAEEHKAGEGKHWIELWKSDRVDHYQPKFIELMNQGLEDKGVTVMEDVKSAKYKMIVKTTFIEPGYNVGVSRRDASINLEISFINIETGKEMAKFTILKSPGRTFAGSDFDSGLRVGEAYAKAGKSFSKFLLKKKAF